MVKDYNTQAQIFIQEQELCQQGITLAEIETNYKDWHKQQVKNLQVLKNKQNITKFLFSLLESFIS